MTTLEKLIRGTGWYIKEPAHDTPKVPCKNGHIYADGDTLIASMDRADLAETRLLKKLGTPVMDGDFGELSVAFPKTAIRQIAKVLKPLQKPV